MKIRAFPINFSQWIAFNYHNNATILIINFFFVDLNEMTLNEPKPIVQIDSNNNGRYSIQLVPNLGQHILATGPRYNVDQLKIIAAHHLGYFTSGVLGRPLVNYKLECILIDS